MGLRPRTKFVKKQKSRRCSKCGGKLSSQQFRCKRCSSLEAHPKKGSTRNG
jgi:hypothetical protein